jgi:hypothetical protein
VADADLERSLAGYREAYGRKLPDRLAQLEILLLRGRRVGGRQPIEAARALAHRLMGTSGSYGFDAACAELARIEADLARLLDGGAEPGAAWEGIEAALARARAGLRDP